MLDEPACMNRHAGTDMHAAAATAAAAAACTRTNTRDTTLGGKMITQPSPLLIFASPPGWSQNQTAVSDTLRLLF